MNKIHKKISKLISKITLKKLAKVKFVFTDDEYIKHVAPGPKTYGYMNPWKAIWHAFNLIYGDKMFIDKYVQGITIDENENEIILKVFTSRPGLIIGKAGIQIESFEKKLTEVFGKNTSVNLSENTAGRYGLQYCDFMKFTY